MIVAVTTTRNERESILWLISYLRKHVDHIIVVDEGSTDGTAEQAREMGAEVILASGGIGRCLIYGWKRALELGATRIVQIDAGKSHNPNDVPLLLSSDADIVIGSRFCSAAQYHGRPWRAAMSKLAAWACNWAQPGAEYTDWTSGYRVFSRTAAKYLSSLTYQGKMHEWQIEVLAYAGEHSLSIVEVPITYIAGQSSFKLKTVWAGFRMWRHVWKDIGYVGYLKDVL